MKRLILFLAFLPFSISLFAQARIILNGASINISQGAYLVVANPATNAITRTSGSIISEGENNIIKWNIGTTSGSYVIPWSYNGNDIPLSFTPSGGVGASGYFQFSTYHTGWLNSAVLPSTVTNFNRPSGGDNSKYALDRFWRIESVGYTTRPTLSNLIFTYPDIEHSIAENTIPEAGVRAQRWNSTTSTWTDYDPSSSVNTTNNQLTIASVDPSNSFAWWSLTYLGERHWLATTTSNWNSTANWSVRPGGTAGATVPIEIDEVFFDDIRDGNITLDAPATISTLNVAPGYSGVINQGTQSITVSNAATLAGGSFNGGSAFIRIGNHFTLSGTAFTSTSDTLDIKGNFSLTGGTFVHNSGTVKFSGTTTPQTITSATPVTFNHIKVSNVAIPGISIESNQNLQGVLSLSQNVRVDADGSSNSTVFTLLSTADAPVQDGAVASLPTGASIDGNVTVQRFMTIEGANNNRIYRYISSPIQAAAVSDIQNEIPITGSFTGYSVCATCLRNQSMFAYNESVITDINGSGIADFNDGYIDFPDVSNTEPLQPGRGYALFVRGNILPSARWDVRGEINEGNVTPITLPVTYTTSGTLANDGWNLVGNPFPSTIDWNSATGWTKNNVGASIYIHDNGVIPWKFATWNGTVGTNGGSRYIAMGQGFWVKANGVGVPSLQANENVKQPFASATFFREGTISDMLRLTLSTSIASDETVIHFRPDATPSFDAHADAWKLKNEKCNLSSLGEQGELLAINSRGTLLCQDSVKLSVDDTAPGNYQLSFTNVDSFDGASVFLADRFTNTTISFDNDTTYGFAISVDPATFGSERFRLLVTRSPQLTITETDGVLSVPYEKSVQWYLDGKIIAGADSSSYRPILSGTYRVIVFYQGCELSGSFDYIITEVEETNSAAINVYPNPSTGEFFITMTSLPGSIVVIDPMGKLIGNVNMMNDGDRYSGSIDLSDRASGIYILLIQRGERLHRLKLIRK